MEQRKTTVKKKKYKILWHRVIIALIILAAVIGVVIWGIVSIISAIAGAFSDDDSSSAKDAAASVESSSAPVVTSSREPESSSQPQVKLKVVVDAGHGGKDAGAINPNDETHFEKDDVLKLALLVEQRLKEKGVEVIMTRDEDVFVTLDNRCIIANEAKADLFVSIHRNLYDGEAQGVEIWVNNKRIEADTLLGQNIMDGLDAAGISRNRGVNFGFIGNPHVNYQVNRETDMPSCLIELGFMQDETDNELFEKNYEKYATAIADGIWKTAKELGLVNS